MRASFGGRRSLQNPFAWVLCCSVLGYFAVLHFYGVNLGEESATVFLLYRTARGELPYVEFISGYTPGYFFFHGALLRWFGEHLSVVRLPLVAVHTVNVWLLFHIGTLFLPRAWALVAALAYPALMPVVEASELSFNVPYPAWYCITFFLLGWLIITRAQATNAWRLWFVAGLLAGASFAFKPNSGLFQLALAALAASGVGASHWPSWAITVAAAVVAGVVAVFRHHLLDLVAFVFLAPFVVTVVSWLGEVASRPGKTGDAAKNLLPSMVLVAGFALVTLPWLLPYGFVLGPQRLWREVLFVGSGYEQHFYIRYDWSWPLFFFAAAGMLLLWWLPLVVGRGSFPKWCAWLFLALAGVATVTYAALAPKPEGVVQAVISAVRKGIFVLVPLAHWIPAVRALASRVFGGRHRESESFVFLSLGAQGLFWNAYPRSDFFHLAYAAPLSLVLLTRLAQECVSRWVPLLPRGTAHGLTRMVPGAALGMLLVCAIPQLRVAQEVVGFSLGWSDSLEWWDTARGAVLIRSDAAGKRQRDFAAVARWLVGHGAVDNQLWTFPDLDLLGFLAGTRHPARIGYFKSGWPGHAVEAEVVDDLKQRPPRFLVTEYPPSLFFYDAAGFFFLLKQWVEERYVVFRHVGSFRLWVERGDSILEQEAADQVVEPTRNGGPQLPVGERCDRSVLQKIRFAGNGDAVRRWVEAWVRVGARSWDVGCSRLGLRVAAELGEARVAWDLASARLAADSALYADWANALWAIALRNLLLRWQFGGADSRVRFLPLTDQQTEEFIGWLGRERDPRIRLYLVWALSTAATPELVRRVLREAMGPENGGAAVLERALLLSRLEGTAADWQWLSHHFADFPSILPALFLEWTESSTGAKTAVIEEALRSQRVAVRETAAYLTVPAGLCSACSALTGVQENDPAWQVRRAANWARKQLGCDLGCTLRAVSR